MPVYFNRLKLYFRFIYLFFLVHLHLLFGKIGWCRFYVQVKILQRTKLPVEWLICWGSFNKLYHLLPLHQRGHPCSLNSSLRYNPSFHLSCFLNWWIFILYLFGKSPHLVIVIFLLYWWACLWCLPWVITVSLFLIWEAAASIFIPYRIGGHVLFLEKQLCPVGVLRSPILLQIVLHNLLCGLLLRQCFWLVESKGEE